ncbi:MAG: type II 3-dehydroquinate dehydratase [Opitutales bacterium]|nr:type II 3-dehydroquinate dehydratase [Opitutales bacterium]
MGREFTILNGPNLDRLGKREPEVYGTATLADLEDDVRTEASALGVDVSFFQSNHEGALIDKVADLADGGCAGLIMNPGGLTHTSVALRDAIAGSGLPAVEVHISNIYRRETFRHTSMTAPACEAVISGLGFEGYLAALRYLAKRA